MPRTRLPSRLAGSTLSACSAAVIASWILFCCRYNPASSAGISADVGSSSIARLYAAIAPDSSSFSANRWPIRNCAYASAVLSDARLACEDVDDVRCRRGSAFAAAAETRKTHRMTDHFILELFHKWEKVSYIPDMPVDPELLEILACPNCKTPVTPGKNGTALKCAPCKRVYPVKDDIPVMLIDEATTEND